MQIIGQYLNYREYLRDELRERTNANPQYSLRAFARDLSIAPQILSLVLNGKKNISTEVAVEIAMKLKLSANELNYFYDLVELSQARSEVLKDILKQRLMSYEENKTYRVLQEDIFKIIADWHHYAIMELTYTKGFKSDTLWIAKRLGIPPSEVKQAIERLLRLELIEEVEGTLIKSEVNLASTQDVPSTAIRSLTKQLLEKAIDSLEVQSLDERDFGTITMAIDPKKLPEAKKMIRKFRRELCEFLESGYRAEVYTFSTQLFKLTKK